MPKYSVNVQPDYLQRLTRVKKPVIAIAELVWNALDADATRVRVSFEADAIGTITKVRVSDNGSGIQPEQASASFENLGGSWKQVAKRSHKGRLLHGRAGKGRFRAFALGADVAWDTVYEKGGALFEYIVRGSVEQLKTFDGTDPLPSKKTETGTEVVITNIAKAFKTLRGPAALQAMAEEFAIYLRQYTDVEIVYDGARIDPSLVERDRREYVLDNIEIDDQRAVSPRLLIIEWRVETDRALFLCDSDGFALERTTAGIQAPGFNFTAYLRDDYIRELDGENRLTLDELDPGLKPLVEAARAKLKEHFRSRAALDAAEVVSEWKKEAVYPFVGEPKDNIDRAKRQVFDVVALNVHNYLPEFRQGDPKSRRLQLRLLRQAIEDSPASVRKILHDVLDLPEEKQSELAELLDRTTLSAIIAASALVTERLDFLRGLEYLVFDTETKQLLLERRQLHKIVEKHTWLFGEEFNLTVSDQSLTDVLRKHNELHSRDIELDVPVQREDGSAGIVDLMLSRRVPQSRPDVHEHLVVELKRPTKKIDLEVITQVKSYAFAVASDERFRNVKTRWVFWAVSNDLSADAQRDARQTGRPEGLIHSDQGTGVEIWIKTWGQVIDAAKSRLSFFQKGLEYEASDESALAYLRRVHSASLPAEVAQLPASRSPIRVA